VQTAGDDVFLLSFDVAGAGVLPVIYGVALRAAFRTAVRSGADLPWIADALHTCVMNDLPAPCRVPTWLGRLERPSGELHWLSLGHAPALVLTADETLELPGGGPIVGDGEKLVVPPVQALTLPRGGVLAVVSDGVLEAMDDERNRFGSAGIADAVSAAGCEDANRLMDALRDALASGRPAPDDRSILLIRRHG